MADGSETVKSPSYHDVVVYVNGQAHKISDNYAYELTCTRTGGWQLYWHGDSNFTGLVTIANGSASFGTDASMPTNRTKRGPLLIGGEFHGGTFRIEVNGVVVCDSRPDPEDIEEANTP